MINKALEARKPRLERVRTIVKEANWRIKDLKQINNRTSKQYKLAIEKRIPDGTARGFLADFVVFKPHWRRIRTLIQAAQEEAHEEK